MATPLLTAHKVQLKRGDHLIQQNLHFVLNQNENIGIYGSSGTGKSTFLDLLAGKLFSPHGELSKPSYKEIELVPRDYSFHKLVGAAYQYYQQRYHAHDSEIGPSLREVLQGQIRPIGTINEASVQLAPPLYAEKDLVEVAKMLRVFHLLDRKVTSLSNGETRRSLLCYALLKKPRLLLLDNPFTGLDTQSKADLKELLTDIKIPYIIVASTEDFPENITRYYHFSKENVTETGKPHAKPEPTKWDLSRLLQADTADFKTAFSIKNGWVKYGESYAIKDINWTIKKGECWALLGPNGSGKSTLLSLIMADNPQAYQNDIHLFDKPRGSGESIWDLKRKTGYISPELHLFFPKNQRVWKIIASGFFDTIGLIHSLKPEQEQQLDVLIHTLKLESIRERSLSQLSTGEQRLVLLARALIKNPPLLVLDEPCQNLDYTHMLQFRELINELVTKTGKTLIYVTHNTEELPKCINKSLFLENGRVLECK